MSQAVPLVLDIVDRTMRQSTMRVALAARRGNRVAESQDERATGVATNQQISLLAERGLTQRSLDEHLEETARRMADSSAHDRIEMDAGHRELATKRIFLYERGSWMHVTSAGVWSSRTHRIGDARAPRDPLWILDALRGATTCESIGSEEVRGIQAQRYRLEVNLAAADSLAPFGLKYGATRRARLTQPAVRKWRASMPAEIWVDHERRLRRATWLGNPLRVFLARAIERRDPLWFTQDLWDFGMPAVPPTGRPGEPADDALNYLAALPVLPDSAGT